MLNWAGMLPFVLITTFTPGPNNITSASMGMLYGYRKSLPFLMGIVSGFFMVMLLSGTLSQTLVELLPSFEIILRVVGAMYIGWLAYETLRSSYDFELIDQPPLTFWRGFLMQLLNVKAIFYGMTLYSSFLRPLSGRMDWLLLSAVCLAGLGCCSVTIWTLFGTVIHRYLKKPALRKAVNVALTGLLLYTAIEISGVLELI
ncbi:MAG: LysE family transporter [Chloroflexi bacterium]|nr:LysE family transporter [Chloroflexota bacterium]